MTKDPYMLAALAEDFWGINLIKSAGRLNNYMPLHMVKRVYKLRSFEPRSAVTVLGVAYNCRVDYTRKL